MLSKDLVRHKTVIKISQIAYGRRKSPAEWRPGPRIRTVFQIGFMRTSSTAVWAKRAASPHPGNGLNASGVSVPVTR